MPAHDPRYDHRIPGRPPRRAPPALSIPTQRARSLELGLNVGDIAFALPWLRAARTRHVRFAVYWRNMSDPRPHAHLGGRSVERQLLDEVHLAVGAGLDVLLVLHAAPDDDPYGRGFPSFVASLAGKLPAGVTFQLLNEPDDPTRVWTPRLRGATAREWGASYAALFVATAEALAARGAARRLVAGGLVGDPRPFLQGMLRAGGRPPEIVACHCYGQPAAVQAARRARLVREILPDARVWYTEVGSELGMNNPQQQARDLVEAIDAARAAGVDRLYWYRLDGPERGFELVHPAGPRPAWRRWVELSAR